MGIKNLSDVFKPIEICPFKNIRGERIAIDIMGEIYRSALGASSVETLTDKNGKPTLHISVILSNISTLIKNSVDIIACFDHGSEDEKAHNPHKVDELIKRKNKRDVAQGKLTNYLKPEIQFDINDEDEQNAIKSLADEQKINSLQKQTFRVDAEIIRDVKFILDCLNIKYVEAPSGYEGEAMCVALEYKGLVDASFSGDTDLIPLGSKKFYRRHPKNKKIYKYSLENILHQIEPGAAALSDLRKICVVLGGDYCERTRGIGPKTVLRKYKNVVLSEKQKGALTKFSEEYPEIGEIYNGDKTQATNCQFNLLVDWLVEEKGFSRGRVEKQFDKLIRST